jgi:hypothetical protein
MTALIDTMTPLIVASISGFRERPRPWRTSTPKLDRSPLPAINPRNDPATIGSRRDDDLHERADARRAEAQLDAQVASPGHGGRGEQMAADEPREAKERHHQHDEERHGRQIRQRGLGERGDGNDGSTRAGVADAGVETGRVVQTRRDGRCGQAAAREDIRRVVHGRRVGLQGRQDGARAGKAGDDEVRGRDTDDGARHVIDDKLAADDASVAVELGAPEPLPDDDGARFFRSEESAEPRLHAQQIEQRARGGDGHDVTRTARQVGVLRANLVAAGAHVVQLRPASANIDRHGAALATRGGIDERHDVELIGRRIGKRTPPSRIGDGEHG